MSGDNINKVDSLAIADLFADISEYEDKELARRMKRTKQALSHLVDVAFQRDKSPSPLRTRARYTAFLIDGLRHGAGRRICFRAGSMIGGCAIFLPSLCKDPEDWLLTLADTQELLGIVEGSVEGL